MPLPAWEAIASVVETWGRIRVVIDGVDVTFLRLAPVKVTRLTYADPFGPVSAVIEFPQVSAYDIPGAGDLSWLRDFATVEIDQVHADESGTTRMFDGVLGAFSYSEMGLQAIVMGTLYEADLMVRGPRHLKFPIPREEWIMFTLTPQVAVRSHLDYKPVIIEGGSTGFLTRHSGNYEKPLTGYVADSLAQMINLDGSRWTLQMDEGVQPVLRMRDVTTVHYSAWTGQPGVALNLDYDPTTIPTRIHGSGVDQAGTEWRRIQYLPKHPLTETNPIALASTATTHAEVYHDPTNTLTGPAPGYDPTITKVEQHILFPYGISMAEAMEYAQRQVDETAHRQVLTGSITFTADPEECSRMDIRAGKNLLLRGFQGRDVMLHIAGVDIDVPNLSVTCKVDERGRDLLTVEDIIARQKEVAESPSGRLRIGDASAISEDTRVAWNYDAGSGYIPYESRPVADPTARVSAPGGQWTIVPILASTKGQAQRLRLSANVPVAFHVSFYAEPVSAADLIANPLAPDAWIYWDDDIRQLSVYGAGQVTTAFGPQRAGFWPGLETRPDGGSDPVTGVLQDDGSWEWDLDAQLATLWCAIYPAASATFQGRIYHGVQ